jgi:hypothetical protein
MNNNKKPTPVIQNVSNKICPICGKVSYSRDGIHPQCAIVQADAPREQQRMAKKKAEAKKKPVAKKLSPTWNQKKCPKCDVQVSVRKKICDCGFNFFKS